MTENSEAPQEAAKTIEPPRFVGGKSRSEVVPLEWPLEYDGKIWSEITVSRMNTAQIAEFIASLDGDNSEKLRFPMFDVPNEILDALDDDDATRVNEVVERFLPRRFRGAREQEPASETGAQ